MATVEANRRTLRTYGNWRQPTSPGLLGLGTVGTGLMFVALLIVIVVLMTTNILNVVVTAAVVGGMILLLTIRDADGRSVLSRNANRLAWRRRRAAERMCTAPARWGVQSGARTSSPAWRPSPGSPSTRTPTPVRDNLQPQREDVVDRDRDGAVIEELQAQAGTAARRAVAAALDQLEDAEPEDEPTLYFGSVDEFFRDYLRPNYRRRVDGSNTLWARDCWNYAEAVARLDALRRAWEHLRPDPATGMSVWFRDHAEHHMAVLLSPSGPFAGIGTGKNREHTNEKGQPLPYVKPPEGLFPRGALS